MHWVRARVGIASLVVLLASLPTAQTQEPSSPTVRRDSTVTIPDAMGDVVLNVASRAGGPGQNASQLGGAFDHVDILRVVFGDETEKDFKIYLYMKKYDPPQQGVGFAYRIVSFTYDRIDWRITPGNCQRFSQPPPNLSCLGYRDAGMTQYRGYKAIPTERRDGAFVFTLSKEDIFNQDRVPGQYGRSLVNIAAEAYHVFATTGFLPTGDATGGVMAVDRAPNAGVGLQPFTFAEGSGGRGFLAMRATDPIRVSNGEATTIVYKVDLLNSADRPLAVQMTSKEARPDWQVRVPALLKVEAGSSQTFPVIVSLPFTHDHGKTATFVVEGTAVEDSGSVAVTELGVFWTDIPQPSAHHNGEQWFHSAPSDMQRLEQTEPVLPLKSYWMNGIADDPDPDATDEDVPAFFNDYFFCLFAPPGQLPNPANCKTPPEFRASWFFPLAPNLLLGLDFDLSKDGLMVFDIISSLPATTATVDVRLLYCDPAAGGQGGVNSGAFTQGACNNYQTLLAQGKLTQALGAKSQVHFEVPLKIESIADYLPYKRQSNIGLSLTITSDVPQNLILTEPRPLFVTKKARLLLPLIEYHDPIDQAFLNVGSLALESKTDFEKMVNPGRTAAYHFELKSNADVAQRVRLEVQGIHSEWVSIKGEPEFELGAKENRSLTIAVRVPDDAVDEERAELILVAQSLEDSSVVAVSRFRSTVTTSGDIPDEAASAFEGEGKNTPGPGPVALVAAVCVVFFLRRRR